MNVFISIIEEAYVSSKTRDKNHWIYSYLKVDPQFVEIHEEGNKQIEKIEQMNKKIKEHDQDEDEELTKGRDQEAEIYQEDKDFNALREEEKTKKNKENLYSKDYDKIKKIIRSKNSMADILSIEKTELKGKHPKEDREENPEKSKDKKAVKKLDGEKEDASKAKDKDKNLEIKDNKKTDEISKEEEQQLIEVSNYLSERFQKIDNIMDEITDIVNEVKNSNKKSFIAEFQNIVNENLNVLNTKFRELTNFWAYDSNE